MFALILYLLFEIMFVLNFKFILFIGIWSSIIVYKTISLWKLSINNGYIRENMP